MDFIWLSLEFISNFTEVDNCSLFYPLAIETYPKAKPG